MTPKEKTNDLVYETFRKALGVSRWDVKYNYNIKKKIKKIAAMAVAEILKAEQTAYENQEIQAGVVFDQYWREVTKEIEKL